MKTAMQELKCLVQSMLQNGGDDDLWAVLTHIDDKLEKEKEQIVLAYNDGVNDGNTQGLQGKEGNGNYTTLDEYYNKTYNQNK